MIKNERYQPSPVLYQQDIGQQAIMPNEYSSNNDLTMQYGSLIKDLTDTADLIEQFRLRILGRKLNNEGQEIEVRKIPIDEDAIDEYINLLKSIVNQNTHFSKFDQGIIDNILKAVNYHTCRFLMLQGDRVPKGYRAMIATEALALVTASLYKANDGTLLRWSKGTFMENASYNQNQETKSRGPLAWLFGNKR